MGDFLGPSAGGQRFAHLLKGRGTHRNDLGLAVHREHQHASGLTELVEEGGIGQVLYVKAKECHNGTHSPYAKDKKTCGGGSFIHLGVHPIGWMLYFLGRGSNPVVEVTGKMTGGAENNFIHHENGGEDFGMGMMRFSDGEFAFIEGNYITYGGMDDTVEIYGTQGVIKVDLTFGSPITCYSQPGISYSIEKTDHNIGWTKPAVDEFYNLGYVSELAYFIASGRVFCPLLKFPS